MGSFNTVQVVQPLTDSLNCISLPLDEYTMEMTKVPRLAWFVPQQSFHLRFSASRQCRGFSAGNVGFYQGTCVITPAGQTFYCFSLCILTVHFIYPCIWSMS